MPNQIISRFIFETLYRAWKAFLQKGEGKELKEMSTNESDLMTERTKQEAGWVLIMKATDHQPWRDACLLPSLS